MKNTRSAWLTYTALRLLMFAVPFALIYALGLSLQLSMMVSAAIAAVLAALISLSLSVLFLSKPREVASESIYEWRNRDRTLDDIVEDEAMDSAEDSTTPAATADRMSEQAVTPGVGEKSARASLPENTEPDVVAGEQASRRSGSAE